MYHYLPKSDKISKTPMNRRIFYVGTLPWHTERLYTIVIPLSLSLSLYLSLSLSCISKAKLPSPLTCFRADELNRHFTSVSANIPVLTPTNLSEPQITSSSFEFNHVTLQCVQAAINAASSKAVGVDGISVEMVKKLPPFCVNTIAYSTAL